MPQQNSRDIAISFSIRISIINTHLCLVCIFRVFFYTPITFSKHRTILWNLNRSFFMVEKRSVRATFRFLFLVRFPNFPYFPNKWINIFFITNQKISQHFAVNFYRQACKYLCTSKTQHSWNDPKLRKALFESS